MLSGTSPEMLSGNNEKKSYSLVKWDVVTVGKRQGGLGIKNLKNQSKALRMKWLRRFCTENPSYWKEVISAKYEEEDYWMTKIVTTPYKVSVWRSIRSLWDDFKNIYKDQSGKWGKN